MWIQKNQNDFPSKSRDSYKCHKLKYETIKNNFIVPSYISLANVQPHKT